MEIKTMKLNKWEVSVLEKFYDNYEQNGYGVLDISDWKKELGLNYISYSSVLKCAIVLAIIATISSSLWIILFSVALIIEVTHQVFK